MKCELCENNDMVLWIKTSEGNYLKCSNCGLVCRENIPAMSNIKTIYDSEYFIKKKKCGTGADFIGEEKFYLAKFKDRIKRIEKRLKSGRILDIGASVGQFLFIARKAGWDIYGLEVSKAAANMARQQYGIHIKVGSLESVKFGRNFFDVVTLWHVFEHFPDPKQSLKKIHSMLREDGLLVIELPNIGSKKAINSGVKWSYLVPTEHLFHYTPVTISRFLEKANFKIEAIEYVSGGTGIGDCMDEKGLWYLKKFLIARFPLVNWLKKMIIFIGQMWGPKDIMIVFARKI
jgi:SAM-dependent methyltransferase